jgi:hypothetical protein
MTEEYIKSIIKDTLNIPVFLGQESITYPAATLEITVISPALLGDGKSKSRTMEVYINLWYEDKASRDTALTELMSVLDTESGVTSPEIERYFDTTAKKYRAVFHFYTYLSYPEPEPEPEPEDDNEP